ncbi:MAG: LpxI family protein [Terriglobales bacterium]
MNATAAPPAGPPYGLIAGNGRFPFLILEAARSRGLAIIVAAIREETFPEIEAQGVPVTWLSLGQLGKLIELFHHHGVRRAVMAGQVQHKQIFSALRPDWRMVKLLAGLAAKNTDSLLGAVAAALAAEGVELESSTAFLQPLLAGEGPLTPRAPDAREQADIAYGLGVARQLAALDIGQTVVIADRACLAAEAMEGTDATIRRAAALAQGRPLTVVKVAKPKQDPRFDVPVVGPATLAAMREARATCLAVESGITLLLDREPLLAAAAVADIAITGVPRP